MDEPEDELQELFDACDTNGNGSLQFNEFVSFISSVGAGMTEEECRIGFSEIDRDRDGHIDFAEFMSWWTER